MSQALWPDGGATGQMAGDGGCAGVVAGVVQCLAEPHDLVFELGGHALGTMAGRLARMGRRDY